MPTLEDLASGGDLRGLREHLVALDVPSIVSELGRWDGFTRAVAFRSLPKDLALEVFEDLSPPLQRELLEGLREDTVRELVAGLDPDDRAELLDELPAKVAARLLSGLTPHEREMTTTLLGYPAQSAGRRMSPELITIDEHLTVREALDQVRRNAEQAETIYAIPVTGPGRCVVGVVSLRRLFVSDPDELARDLMSEPVTVRAEDNQEDAARVVRDNGMIAVPVVDTEDRLLGLFTVDDAMRVLERADTEDITRSGGSEPLRQPYLSVSVPGLVRVRIIWLLGLVVAATLTVNVLHHFEDTLEAVVTLALFVPLLIGTGGNAGAQAATTVVRALAVGDVHFGDLLRVVVRETLAGALLGTCLALIGFLPAAWFAGVNIAAVLSLTVIAICTLATTMGALIPLVARQVGVDPAVVSAPFITTIVDSTGLILYFVIARTLLGI